MHAHKRIVLLAACAAALTATAEAAAAQAVAPTAQGASVPLDYRRTPPFRNDPFRQLFMPGWGVMFSGGLTAENSALQVRDLQRFTLDDRDAVVINNVVNALEAVPGGSPVVGNVQGEGGLSLGGPLFRFLRIGVSAQGRAFGAFRASEDAVVLLRDGLGGQTDFTIGDTRGSALATSEFGLHALLRFGALEAMEGAQLNIGVGGRYMRPLAYGRGQSLIDSRLAIIGDSIAANVLVERAVTPQLGMDHGSGVVGDFLVRVVWPGSGFALEGMIANVGGVSVGRVERQTLGFFLQTTNLSEVNDSLSTVGFQVQDTVAMDITLPRIVRFAGSAWANAVLQLDAGATLPVEGEFGYPLAVDVTSTWRFVPVLPLRIGVLLGGHQRFGYMAGMGVESRHFLLRLSAGSLGGLFGDARGVSGRFDLGLFF
jgi:hypothetical protein